MDRRETQGAALRRWRKAAKLSQRKAATRLAEFNDERREATQSSWWSWERGEKAPDIFFAFAIERMTGGLVMAEGWAMSRPKPTESSTSLVDEVDAAVLHTRPA